MMSIVPELIEIIVTSNDQPRSDLLVKLVLGMDRKNNYSYILGPTNSEGKTWISKSDLLNQSERCMKIALTDYVSIESGFSGEIYAIVMNKSDLKRAIEAIKLFGPEEYPAGHQEKLEKALTSVQNLDGVAVEIKQA